MEGSADCLGVRVGAIDSARFRGGVEGAGTDGGEGTVGVGKLTDEMTVGVSAMIGDVSAAAGTGGGTAIGGRAIRGGVRCPALLRYSGIVVVPGIAL